MITKALAKYLAAALVSGLCVGPVACFAQPYPSKPVRVVVPYAAGGGADALARTVAAKLQESLGQPFVVDNRPGAGGIGGTEAVARAPGDGYTLLLTDTQIAITPALFPKVPFDVRKDFRAVTLMTAVPLYFAVKTTSGLNSLEDLITRAKAQPGKLRYGSAGVGSLHHIAMESFKSALGLDIVHVPYRGSGQSIVGFMADDVQILVASFPSMLGHMKSGTVKLLANTALRRSTQAPDVPAISESVSGFDFASELGVLAPTGTPQDVIDRLATEIGKALATPDVIKRIS